MTIPLAPLTEEELSRCIPADEESGFGSLHTPRGALPLKDMDIQVTLEDLLASVELSQTFVNTFAEPLEATYIFPLPDRAAVTRFRLDVAGRVIEGELQERGAAREKYTKAIKAGHRAAIMEEERPGTFTIRVGNIPPGESARIRLSLRGPLLCDAGEVTFRFPLVVAPRYIPGQPLSGPAVGDGAAQDTDAVPDASRISPPVLLPGYPNPVRLSLTVDILPTQMPVRDFRCSLHAALLERDDSGKYRLTLQPGERLNRDFILRYQIGAEGISTSLALVPDAGETRQGTFVLTLLPPLPASANLRPRDVIFVLDRSGSMDGWKMVAARRALAHMVESLTERDRFTIYAFDDCLETPPAFPSMQLVSASNRHRQQALEFLWSVEACGGTEMAQPLDQAVKQLSAEILPPHPQPLSPPAERGEKESQPLSPPAERGEKYGSPRPGTPGRGVGGEGHHLTGERDRVLVLITDGQVGNEDQILRMLGTRLEGLRIFTLGIDQAVNEGFLRRLASLGGGSCDVVESETRLEEVMYKVQRRIGAPVLSHVRVDMAGVNVEPDSMLPSRKLDLFAGVPLVIEGRYRGAPEGRASIQATDEAGRPWTQTIAGRPSDHPAAAVLWARHRLRDLEDRYIIETRHKDKLEKRIVQTSLRFGVLCRFTAFVAVDKSEVVNPGGEQHQIVQAVEAPAGWDRMVREAFVVRPMARFSPASHPLASPPPAPCASPPAGAMPPVNEELDEADEESAGSCLERFEEETEDEAPPARRTRSESRGPSKKRKAAPKAESGGIFGKLFGHASDKSEKADRDAAKAPQQDLTAYRKRAEELLAQLRQTVGRSDEQRLQALGILAVKLGELLEDMKSIGLAAAVLEPLEKLHTDLQALLAQTQPEATEVERLWQQAETTLQEFVTPTAAAGKDSGSFWKG